MGIPGVTELLIIGGIVLLIFGGRKLPQLGGALGESIKNFKKGVQSVEKEEQPKLDNPDDLDSKK